MDYHVIATVATGAFGLIIRVLDRKSKREALENRTAAAARVELEKELREQISDLEQRWKACEEDKRAEIGTLRQLLSQWQDRYHAVMTRENKP